MSNSRFFTKRMRAASAFWLFIFSVGLTALGQTPTATITGQVRDNSDAAVAGARVVVRNTQTNRARGRHQRERRLHHPAARRRRLSGHGRKAGLQKDRAERPCPAG
jgi:hypothetical protein